MSRHHWKDANRWDLRHLKLGQRQLQLIHTINVNCSIIPRVWNRYEIEGTISRTKISDSRGQNCSWRQLSVPVNKTLHINDCRVDSGLFRICRVDRKNLIMAKCLQMAACRSVVWKKTCDLHSIHPFPQGKKCINWIRDHLNCSQQRYTMLFICESMITDLEESCNWVLEQQHPQITRK